MGHKSKLVPVTVTMRVTCGCGHAEDETYEFDMPARQAQPMEACEPGTCPECQVPRSAFIYAERCRSNSRYLLPTVPRLCML